MPHVARTVLALGLLFTFALPPVAAQRHQPPEDIPAVLPTRAETPKVRDQREALHLYVLGLLCEREDRLLEALQAWERSAKLDPDVPAVHRGLIALYVALERPTDALAETETVLRLDPDDFHTWFFYARQLRVQDKLKDAATALRRGLDCSGSKEHPELCQQMFHDLGVLCERSGNLADAVAAFGQAAARLQSLEASAEVEGLNRQEIQMRVAELYERMGRGHLQLKQIEPAIAAFQKAQTSYPDGAGRLNYNLAQVCLEGGRVPDALGYLDNYLRLQPQGTDAYELKIKLLQQSMHAAEIVPWLEKASAADRHNLGLKLLLAQQYSAAKQLEQAEAVYLTLLDDAPSSNVYRGLFAVYQSQGQAGMVRALGVLDGRLEQARKKQESGSNEGAALVRALLGAFRGEAALCRELLKAGTLSRSKELQGETLHFLAVLAEQQKQWPAAEHFYRRSLAQPTDVKGVTLIQGGLLRLLWKTHKYAEVVEVCRKALEAPKAPNAVLFHSELARALVMLGKVDDGLAEVDQALKVSSDLERLRLRVLRVRLLSQGERHDLAEKECQSLLKEATLPGDKLELHYLLSAVYSAAHQLAKSEEQLERCLQLDPNSATVNNDLGYLWADQRKHLKEAEGLIRKALELDRRQKKSSVPFAIETEQETQDNAAYIDSLGWVLFRRGQFEAARLELERATTLPDSDDPVIWDHLGDVYRQLGQWAEARAAWQKALDFYGPDKGRKMDERQQELHKKLKSQETTIPSR